MKMEEDFNNGFRQGPRQGFPPLVEEGGGIEERPNDTKFRQLLHRAVSQRLILVERGRKDSRDCRRVGWDEEK